MKQAASIDDLKLPIARIIISTSGTDVAPIKQMRQRLGLAEGAGVRRYRTIKAPQARRPWGAATRHISATRRETQTLGSRTASEASIATFIRQAWARPIATRQSPRGSGQPLYRTTSHSDSKRVARSRVLSAGFCPEPRVRRAIEVRVPAPLASLSNGLNLDFTRADLRIVADAFSHERPR